MNVDREKNTNKLSQTREKKMFPSINICCHIEPVNCSVARYNLFIFFQLFRRKQKITSNKKYHVRLCARCDQTLFEYLNFLSIQPCCLVCRDTRQIACFIPVHTKYVKKKMEWWKTRIISSAAHKRRITTTAKRKTSRKIHVTQNGRSQEQTSMHFNWSKIKILDFFFDFFLLLLFRRLFLFFMQQDMKNKISVETFLFFES